MKPQRPRPLGENPGDRVEQGAALSFVVRPVVEVQPTDVRLTDTGQQRVELALACAHTEIRWRREGPAPKLARCHQCEPFGEVHRRRAVQRMIHQRQRQVT